MCEFLKPDVPEIPEPEEPEILVNPFDDAPRDERTARAKRRGRSSLTIPLDTGLGIGFGGRQSGSPTPRAGTPSGNARPRQNTTGLTIS